VERLAVVSSLLLIPPSGVGISVLALNRGGIRVTAILKKLANLNYDKGKDWLTMFGSSMSACDCRSRAVLEKARVARGVRNALVSGLAANNRRDSICRENEVNIRLRDLSEGEALRCGMK
jgi:hypothetical protein